MDRYGLWWLDKYNLSNNTWTNYFSGFVSSIAIDSSNVKWLGTGGGVFKFENGAVSKNFTSVNSPLPNDNVNVVNVANNQNI